MDNERDMPAAGVEAAAAAAPPAGMEAERLIAQEREIADLKDRLLRALAEVENIRRRSEREVQDARTYGIARFATDLLPTADNLRRALEARPTEAEESDALKAFVDGVELTERDLLKALERHGVTKRMPTGEKFDPHLDQAMFEVPDETVPSGTVVQVMQAGYRLGDRVLRPAMVGVSKGGPARAAEPAASESPAPHAGAPGMGAKDPGAKDPGATDANAKPRVDKRA